MTTEYYEFDLETCDMFQADTEDRGERCSNCTYFLAGRCRG